MKTIPFKYNVRVKAEGKDYGFSTAVGVAQFCLTYSVQDLEITKNGEKVELPPEGISTDDLRRRLDC